MAFFEQAIARDPKFARAYAGLANAIVFTSFFDTLHPPEGYLDRAIAASKRALALDSTLADAHIPLGSAYQLTQRWDDARTEYVHAIALAPSSSPPRYYLGIHALTTSRIAQGIDELKRAQLADPYSSATTGWLAMGLLLGGENDAAVAMAKRAWELDSTSLLTQAFVPVIYADAGRAAEARAVASRIPRSNFTLSSIGYALAKGGDRAGALEIVRLIEAREARGWMDHVGLAYAALGLVDTTRALDELEKSASSGEPFARRTPFGAAMFDPIRHSARFAALIRKANLDEKALTSANGGRLK